MGNYRKPTPEQLPSARIRAKEVADILGICLSSVWKYSKTVPGFPQPKRMGNRFTYWLRSEVEAYANS